ncbi:hypothetical protein Tco_0691487, partial [Tanacetum coccineum]
ESSSTDTPLEQVQNHDENDVFANVRRHSEQPESINDTYVLEKDDSNVIPDSSNICTNDNQVDQNAAECVDEHAALANLSLDTEENKTILKQLKKANASLTECKTNLDESSRALGEATSSRDSCLIALQTKQTKLEKYTALNDLTLVNQKHDELVKKSLLNRSQFEGQLKEKTKVISDLKVKEWKWWKAKRCPSSYTWTQKPLKTKKTWIPKIIKANESTSISPTIDIVSRITNIVQLILFIVDSGCTKHMTGNLKLLCNFVEKFLGTVRFGNVQMTFEHSSSSLGHQCQMTSDLALQRQEMSVENVASGLVPQGQKASDYDNSDSVPPRQNGVPSAEKTDSSHKGLEFLFSPLLEEYYNPTH